jgi:hypothetical protein
VTHPSVFTAFISPGLSWWLMGMDAACTRMEKKKKKKKKGCVKVYPGSPEHSRRWFPGDFLTPADVPPLKVATP